MITMYGFWRSQAAFRVRIAFKLKGLAYEETMVDIDVGEQFAPEFLAKNPQGAVPALIVEGGPPLTQSLAILEYLEEVHPEPAILPKDPRDRARVRSIALLFAGDHHPLIVPRVRRYLTGTLNVDGAQEKAWVAHWLGEGLRQGEARLSGDPQKGAFVHGDAPSIADICLASFVATTRVFGVETATAPTVLRIADACFALPAFADAAPMRQPGAPKAA